MKLASYQHNGRRSYGVVTDSGIVDAIACLPDGPRSVRELLQAGPEAMTALADAASRADSTIPLADVRLLPPVLDPPKLLGLAVNYEAHHNELKRPAALPADARHTTTPRPFLMPPTALAGCGDEIAWPAVSEQVDHEVELAVIIGREGRCLAVEEALDVVAGYTIANDLSARSMTHAQGRTERPKDDFFDWLHGKWPDGFLPMGPWLVTADEVGNAGQLDIELSVNGDPRQGANTSHMIFSIAETISFISHIVTLQVGDVIATGTPSGVAKATGKWLEPGDVVTCRIDKLGELTNTIGPRPDGFYRPCRKD
jgi:2-keto-4-pentenoate hydratase/2-oxohepta-3-ene-1,7-dioic acid hydratase in catechol pathway